MDKLIEKGFRLLPRLMQKRVLVALPLLAVVSFVAAVGTNVWGLADKLRGKSGGEQPPEKPAPPPAVQVVIEPSRSEPVAQELVESPLATRDVEIDENGWYLSPPKLKVSATRSSVRADQPLLVSLSRLDGQSQLASEDFDASLFLGEGAKQAHIHGTLDTGALLSRAGSRSPHGWWGVTYRLGSVVSARFDFSYAFGPRFNDQGVENPSKGKIASIEDGKGLRMSHGATTPGYSSINVPLPFEFPGGIMLRGRAAFRSLSTTLPVALEVTLTDLVSGNCATVEIEAAEEWKARMKSWLHNAEGPSATNFNELPKFDKTGTRDVYFLVRFQRMGSSVHGELWLGHSPPKPNWDVVTSVSLPSSLVKRRPNQLTLRIRGAGEIVLRDFVCAEADQR
ncbi:MAG TPA: hypothetical protein VF777_02170 [Phycisphaerales bacterium]